MDQFTQQLKLNRYAIAVHDYGVHQVAICGGCSLVAPNADIRFYDTEHFALETDGNEIISVIRKLLDDNLKD